MDFDENNLDENNIKKLEAILEKKKKEDENNKTKNNKTKSNKTKNITIQNKEDPQHMTVIFQQVVKLKLPFLIDVSYLNQIDLSENDLIVKKQVKNEKRTWLISIFQKSELDNIFQKENLTIEDKIDPNNKRMIVLTPSDKLTTTLEFDSIDYKEELGLFTSYEKYPDYLVVKKIITSYDNSWNQNINKTDKAIDLFNANKYYLEETFITKYLNLLKNNYTFIPKHKQNNIDHFTNVYHSIIKLKHNDESGFRDTTLFDSIKIDNRIKVLWGSCLERLKEFPCESVGLMITSPPYYNARDYSVWPNLKAYLDDMRNIIQECYRVLDNHRVFVFNISDVVDNDRMEEYACEGHRKIPLPAYFITIFEECGFRYIDDIIWDKGEVQSSRHKNKSKPWPFYQYSCNCYEHILIFSKHRLEKDIRYPCSD